MRAKTTTTTSAPSFLSVPPPRLTNALRRDLQDEPTKDAPQEEEEEEEEDVYDPTKEPENKEVSLFILKRLERISTRWRLDTMDGRTLLT